MSDTCVHYDEGDAFDGSDNGPVCGKPATHHSCCWGIPSRINVCAEHKCRCAQDEPSPPDPQDEAPPATCMDRVHKVGRLISSFPIITKPATPSTPADVDPGVIFQMTSGGSSPRPTSLILVTGPTDPRDATIAALRAILVEVEAYVLNCRNAYPAPSRLETDDLLRRVREAVR